MDSGIVRLLNESIVAVNLGLRVFAESLEDQAVEVVRVTWSPPAGGDEEMMDILEDLL